MNLEEKLSDKPYFSIRININTQTTLTMLTEFLKRWKFVYACFEHKDKDVKNDHTHIIIWDKGCDEVEFEKNFIKTMKAELKGTRSHGQFAVDHVKKSFERACLYLSKGTKEEEPTIFFNTYFTSPEISEMWLMFWRIHSTSIKKEQEDTSLRQIEVIKRNHWAECTELLTQLKDTRHTSLETYAVIAEFWFDRVVSHFERDIKEWEDKKVAAIISGLMLQTLPKEFKAHKQMKVLSMVGLNNFEKNILLADHEDDMLMPERK